MATKQIHQESLVDLRRRLNMLPARSRGRRLIMRETAELYGVSETTLYRMLNARNRPKALRRSDYGRPRNLSKSKMEKYCEVIAAIKIRTSNGKGRHLSTSEAIRLLEEHGIETPDGFVKAPKSLLKVSTVNRYMQHWRYDIFSLCKQTAAVRFQAVHSNDCWQFDLSVSDLKRVKEPSWIKEGHGHPLLMLYSVVDDRSGVAYQEYRCVYGEDVEAALRFLFNAMSPKKNGNFLFQGIPQMIYMDNGPIARSHVFQQVMRYLNIDIRTHLPRGKDGRRQTARSKGKVERPFRTVKEMHETLYHFNEPENEDEANVWLLQFLLRYNDMRHRSESHSRMEDWIRNQPSNGIRQMCGWDRFCTFAREPERRTVGSDAQVSIDGTAYQLDSDLAGEKVILWWGIFDNELFVEFKERRYGPYSPSGGPIPLHRYRKFKKSELDKKADRVEALSAKLVLPKAAMEGGADFSLTVHSRQMQPFDDPDPFQEFTYPNTVAAKKAIYDFLGKPLATLEQEKLEKIDSILNETLQKNKIMEQIKEFLK